MMNLLVISLPQDELITMKLPQDEFAMDFLDMQSCIYSVH